MAVGILFSIVGLGALCILVYRLAVYALPTAAGFAVGWWAIDAGAGVLGGIVVGAIAALATLVGGRHALGAARSMPARAVVALAFALPAAYAGYHVVLTLGQYGVPSDAWRQVFAVAGGGMVGFSAVARLMVPLDAVRGDHNP